MEKYGRAEIIKYERERAKETKTKTAKYLAQINQPGKLELILKNPQADKEVDGI